MSSPLRPYHKVHSKKTIVSAGVFLLAAVGTSAFLWLSACSSPTAGPPTTENAETSDDASVRAAFDLACEIMKPQDYDATTTVALDGVVVRRDEARHSGDNEHTIQTRLSSEGRPEDSFEYVFVGGTFYSRSVIDETGRFGEWKMSQNMPQESPLPCLRPGRYEGSTLVRQNEPSGEQRYSYTVVFTFEGSKVTRTREFWADSTGRPMRARKTYTLVGLSVEDVVYYGFGEPNVITAPSLP